MPAKVKWAGMFEYFDDFECDPRDEAEAERIMAQLVIEHVNDGGIIVWPTEIVEGD